MRLSLSVPIHPLSYLREQSARANHTIKQSKYFKSACASYQQFKQSNFVQKCIHTCKPLTTFVSKHRHMLIMGALGTGLSLATAGGISLAVAGGYHTTALVCLGANLLIGTSSGGYAAYNIAAAMQGNPEKITLKQRACRYLATSFGAFAGMSMSINAYFSGALAAELGLHSYGMLFHKELGHATVVSARLLSATLANTVTLGGISTITGIVKDYIKKL